MLARICWVAAVAILGVGQPAPAGVADDFKKDLAIYLALPEPKALALAEDSSGTAVWGFSYASKSVSDAVAIALDECQTQKQKFGVTAECHIALLGNSGAPDSGSHAEPSATPKPVPTTPTYTSQWVNGAEFLVGSSGDIQVWVTFSSKDQPNALVYVVNGSETPFTFIPSDLAIDARSLRSATAPSRMRTFSADEYEKKVRNRQAFQAGLEGAAAALANQPQPRTSTVQGSSAGSATAWGPGGWATAHGTGTYSGTITTWPTAQDYAAANARTAAQIRAMTAQLTQSFQALASTLARTHTLAPHSYYGGVVYFERRRADQYVVSVPFAGRAFTFTFARR